MKQTNYAYLSGRLGAAYQSITTHSILLKKLDKAEIAEIKSYIVKDLRDQDVAAEDYEASNEARREARKEARKA